MKFRRFRCTFCLKAQFTVTCPSKLRYTGANDSRKTEDAVDHSESEYYMRRAREEARLALRAEKREVAAAHHGLSVEYAARARTAFFEDGPPMQQPTRVA